MSSEANENALFSGKKFSWVVFHASNDGNQSADLGFEQIIDF